MSIREFFEFCSAELRIFSIDEYYTFLLFNSYYLYKEAKMDIKLTGLSICAGGAAKFSPSDLSQVTSVLLLTAG